MACWVEPNVKFIAGEVEVFELATVMSEFQVIQNNTNNSDNITKTIRLMTLLRQQSLQVN